MSKKITWVAWDKTINSLDNGGLGIGSLRTHNLALLAKWWWRFKTEEDLLWKKVVTAIHGPSGKLGESSKVGVWARIANLNKDFENANFPLNTLFSRKLGNGDKTLFLV